MHRILFGSILGIAIILASCLVAVLVSEVRAQEQPPDPLQVWEVRAQEFTGPGWAAKRVVLVYKFQVGRAQPRCHAVVWVAGPVLTTLGEVPCP